MARSSAEQMRAWSGPALFTYGFRPFFLFAAIWAAGAMALWIAMLAGAVTLPTRFDPVSWHAHAFLFGYLGAVIAGFLLTAVPNWTGRLPVVGWRLAGLTAIWVAGRVAVMVSAHLPVAVAPAIDLAFPVALGAVILREIVAGRNWRNLVVLALLAVFTAANLLFYVEAARGTYPANGAGLRLGLAAVIGLIALIGGRIVPSFTRNWLVKRGSNARPAPPMQRFDKAVMLASAVALAIWVTYPEGMAAGLALLAFAALHAARQIRWKGHLTGAEPLVWVLHLAYATLPLGAAAIGLAALWPGHFDPVSAQHLWMAGAFGLMTLAVMTRATLGHGGRALHAGGATVAIYLAMAASVVARLIADALPGQWGYDLSGLLWMLAFAGFALVYGPLLLRRKPEAGS